MGSFSRLSGLGELAAEPAYACLSHGISHERDWLPASLMSWCPLLVSVSTQWPVVVMDPVDVEGGARANFEASSIPPAEKLLVVSLDDALEKEGKPSL